MKEAPNLAFAQEYLNDRGIEHRLSALPRNIVQYTLAVVAANGAAKTWLQSRRILFVGLNDDAFTWHVSTPPAKGDAVVVFGSGLLRRQKEEAAAVVAHELGHIWLKDDGRASGDQAEELLADAKAAEWGFRDALARSLTQDLGTETDESKKGNIRSRIDALRPERSGSMA